MVLRSIDIIDLDCLFDNKSSSCSCRDDCAWPWWCQVCYALNVHPTNSNHSMGTFAQLLHDLEKLHAYSLRSFLRCWIDTTIWDGVGWKKMHVGIHCENPLMSQPMIAKMLSPTMWVQMDNCAKDNKHRVVFVYWSFLVAKGIFKEMFVSF